MTKDVGVASAMPVRFYQEGRYFPRKAPIRFPLISHWPGLGPMAIVSSRGSKKRVLASLELTSTNYNLSSNSWPWNSVGKKKGKYLY